MPIEGTQTVLAPIAPNDANDAYATHIDDYGRGGYRAITTGATTTATNAQIGAQVKPDRRKVGMLLFDISTAKYYRCTNTGGDGSYTVEDFGSTGGSVQSVGLSMPTGFDVANSPVTDIGTLTVSTSLSGVIKGNGSGFVAATGSSDGTAGDYAAAVHTQGLGTINGVGSGRLVGRYSAGTGAAQQLSVGSGLNLDASGVLTASGSGGTVKFITGLDQIDAASPDGITYVISHEESGVAAGTYGNGTTVPRFTVDAEGHITSVEATSISGFLSTGGGTLTGTLNGQGASFSDLTLSGNLTVNGTTTTINSTTLSVDDKNIELGSVAIPSNATADGGGITLKGATDKTLNWSLSTGAWTSSENMALAANKEFLIDGVSVLTKTGLGTTVTQSRLTKVDTITDGTWQGTAVGLAYGGTGADLSAFAQGTIFMKGAGSALVEATAGTDYLNNNSTIDGGGY